MNFREEKTVFWLYCFSDLPTFFTLKESDYELSFKSHKVAILIFHESQSAQSAAILEATNSRWSHVGILFQDDGQWHVAEGAQPVRIVSLPVFIARGKNQTIRVYRLPGLTDAQKKQLRTEINVHLGKIYDIYFEWSDDLVYCSELVYKVFLSTVGVRIGTLQKFRDLRVDGPYVKELIRRRITDTGRTLNLDEPIVTPISQLSDPKLVRIE